MRGLLRTLRRRLLLIVACVLIGAAAAVAYTQLVEPVYASTARVYVASADASDPAPASDAVPAADRAAGYVEVVQSQLLASQVQSRLQADADLGVPGDRVADLDALVDHVSATVVDGSPVVEIRYTDRDPVIAQRLAQAYAEGLVDTVADIERPDGGGALPTTITVIDFASYEPHAISPVPLRDIPLGAAAGLLVGLLLAGLRQLLDNTISSPEQLQAVTDLPVLGSVAHESGAKSRRLVTELDPRTPRVESFRVLRTNVQFLGADTAQKVLVVTSPMAGEGKTSTATNLALTLVRAGVSTLLVDGDLRRPSIAKLFGITGSKGVTTVLLGKHELAEAIWHDDATGLDVLPSGIVPPNAADLVQTQAMAALLQRVGAAYDVVLVDSPPLLPVTDAALLGAQADGVIVVVRYGSTKRDQLALALDRLAQVDVVPAGIVLNDIPTRGVGYGAYGAYGSYGKVEKGRR